MFAIHHTDSPEFETHLQSLSSRGDLDLERVEPAVREILSQVQAEGDRAIFSLAERFEGRRPTSIALPHAVWSARAKDVSSHARDILSRAAERIFAYHQHQKEPGFQYEEDGILLGQRVRPVASAGVYAPGGKARYPSTVLMTAIPASVAGVTRIVLASPDPTPDVLFAAKLSGVHEVIDAGGAQAIAALAYGTETIAAVDKIVGPGNIYVACAKRLVFGKVDIDSIAGPSEILVIADDDADPALVAADLLSQAEHDEDAYPLLITFSKEFAQIVAEHITQQLSSLPRQKIAQTSLQNRGHCFVARDGTHAAYIATSLAPEHLQLSVRNPSKLFDQISSVGAVFLGDHTPEAAGDYLAGPSHVLPTGGAARFASPLGVYDFLQRTSIIQYSDASIKKHADLIESFARLEGLEGHARAVALRRNSKG